MSERFLWLLEQIYGTCYDAFWVTAVGIKRICSRHPDTWREPYVHFCKCLIRDHTVFPMVDPSQITWHRVPRFVQNIYGAYYQNRNVDTSYRGKKR